MPIDLTDPHRQQLLASIARFFDQKLDEPIGQLKAELVLDYMLREFGPTIYNQAIADARKYFLERTQDLEGVCYEKELSYWSGE